MATLFNRYQKCTINVWPGSRSPSQSPKSPLGLYIVSVEAIVSSKFDEIWGIALYEETPWTPKLVEINPLNGIPLNNLLTMFQSFYLLDDLPN